MYFSSGDMEEDLSEGCPIWGEGPRCSWEHKAGDRISATILWTYFADHQVS